MSEIKRNFLKGKMNLDLDERLVPDGETVYSLNNQVAKSEGDDVGAIENSLGNEQKTFLSLTNAQCIGAFPDNSQQVIYYFVTADEKDLVLEYDDKSESVNVILESTRTNGATLLNFDKEKLITGVVKIMSGTVDDDLLIWTDDNEHPRCINIERAKQFGADNFTEDDISLIKRPPIYSPSLNLTYAGNTEQSNINDKFLSFAYAWRYQDGEVSALSPFTRAAFSADKFKLDRQTYENEGMHNIFSAVDVKFKTGEKQVTDIILVFKESNSTLVQVVETFNKEEQLWGDNETQSFKFTNSKIYRTLDENELYRLYDNVPRKAKALDVAGNRLVFANYLEGYDMVDAYGERVKMDYTLSLFAKDLSGSELDSTISMLTNEDDLITFDFTGVSLNKNSRLSFDIELTEKTYGTGTYSESLDFILNKDFSDALALSSDNEFISFVNDVMSNAFTVGYVDTPPANSTIVSTTGFEIDSAAANAITLRAPTITYEIDDTPADPNDNVTHTEISYWGWNTQTVLYAKTSATDSSCKTNRSYEAALIYLDEYGRSTTALTSPDNTLYIPQANSIYQNRIRLNINHKPPVWAKYFRMAYKQNKDAYQTIYASVFYEDGLFRWVKLEGDNKQKVKEGDTLIVKSDLQGAVRDLVKVKVLEVMTKKEDFLIGNVDVNDTEIVEEEGLYMKIKPKGFDMNYSGDMFRTDYQYDKTSKQNPQIWFEELSSFVDGVWVDNPMTAGTKVNFNIRSWEKDVEHLYDKSFVVSEDYANFEDWFNAEVKTFDGKVREWEFMRRTDGELVLRIMSIEDGAFFEKSEMEGTLDIMFTNGVVVFETEPEDAPDDLFYESGQTFEIIGDNHQGNISNQDSENPATIELDLFNCFAMGDGIESYRFKDSFNSKQLRIDTRPTAKSTSEYREIRRYADFTYSEAYVESVGVNGLSNFNLSKANYKDDIVKKYGSVQKIIARDRELICFQEDKVSKILYGQELLLSGDGTSTVSAVEDVLGTQVMYAGQYGISRNPESIAMEGNRIYFTDEKRNQVCRLSMDGITVISRYGLVDWFRKMFSTSMNKAKLGGFDPYNKKYTLSNNSQVIYNPQVMIPCGNTLSKQNFSGTMTFEIDFGISVGDAGVTITSNGKPLTVNITWNGSVFSSTDLSPIVFDKNAMLPRRAEVEVIATDENTDFTITGDCVMLEQFTVVSIIKGGTNDAGETIDNRYKWVSGTYSSPYKHFRTTFSDEDEISIWNSETGGMGNGYIPNDGSKIIIEE